VIFDSYIAEHARAGADGDMVADGGMTLAGFTAGAAQSHGLIDDDVIAHFAGLTNDHAAAVIDEEAFADLGVRMDFDAGEKAAQLRYQTRQERDTVGAQEMGAPMEDNCVQARVQQSHFECASGCRVQAAYGIDLIG
jgi:hypothetical protein